MVTGAEISRDLLETRSVVEHVYVLTNTRCHTNMSSYHNLDFYPDCGLPCWGVGL